MTNAIELITSRFGSSKFDDCDLIVQCGAPVLWPNCHKCEWRHVLWDRVIGKLQPRTPVLNLAAGSCYPWEQQPGHVEIEQDAEYLRKIFGYCRLTTVRDRLAQVLWASLGAVTEFLPCTAFIAPFHLPRPPMNDSDLVLINYMSGGGHYDWNQGIDHAWWRITVSTLLNRLRKRHNILMLCHNRNEYELATDLAPDVERIWPRTPDEYLAAVSRAKGALCNRMHAPVALAGIGIPSVAVGTDTRLLMVETLGLPTFYVKDVTAERLEYEVESLLSQRFHERERLAGLQANTWDKYVDLVSRCVA